MSYKLNSTKNYRLFELCPFNRDISKVKRLRDSMKAHGFIPAYPLHCVRNGDGKLRIKAGHHRFEVATSIGLPVFYIVCDDDATIHELEAATNPWKLVDYVRSYVNTESAEHDSIVEFSGRTGIAIGQSAALLAGELASSGNQHKKVKNGTFVVKDSDFAEKVGSVCIRCREIGIAFATKTNFVSAVSSMCRLPDFEPDVFVHRLAVNSSLAKPQVSLVGYLDMIESVYNHKSQNKMPLAFMARKAARERSVGGRR